MNCGVIYARYSCDKQTENSILGQVRECTEFAKRNGIQIIDIYKDEAISGRTAEKRPAFMRMIKDSTKGLFQNVIVWKGDRFSRSRADSARYKNELKKNGVRVLSATEANVTGPEAILMDGINEAFAEYFSVELAAKVDRGMKQNALDGRFNGGVLPLGYKLDENRKIVIDEEKAKIVREAFKVYTQTKISVNGLETYFLNKGWTNQKGTRVTNQALKAILKNERYIGIYRYKDVTNLNMFPAIVTKEEFDLAGKKLLEKQKLRSAYRTPVKYLLTGKLYCGYCGEMFIGRSGTTRSKDIRRRYVCKSNKDHKGTCRADIYCKELLEDSIVNTVIDCLNSEEIIDLIVDKLMNYQNNGKEKVLIDLNNNIKDIDARISRLNRALEEGIDFEDTIKRIKELKAQRDGNIAELNALKLSGGIYTVEAIKETIYNLRDRKYDDPKLKEFLIETFIDKVILYNDDCDIYYNLIKDGIQYKESYEILASATDHHVNNEAFRLLWYQGIIIGIRLAMRNGRMVL